LTVSKVKSVLSSWAFDAGSTRLYESINSWVLDIRRSLSQRLIIAAINDCCQLIFWIF
jgi:hypothetical protein